MLCFYLLFLCAKKINKTNKLTNERTNEIVCSRNTCSPSKQQGKNKDCRQLGFGSFTLILLFHYFAGTTQKEKRQTFKKFLVKESKADFHWNSQDAPYCPFSLTCFFFFTSQRQITLTQVNDVQTSCPLCVFVPYCLSTICQIIEEDVIV